MKDYVGMKVRSKTLLKSGLKYLGDLKAESVSFFTVDTAILVPPSDFTALYHGNLG